MRRWTTDEKTRVEDLVHENVPVARIAEILDRTADSINQMRLREQIEAPSKVDCFTLRSFSHVMGVHRERAVSWVKAGYITPITHQQGTRPWWLVSHEDVMRFLQDQRTWPEWEPQQMRDPDWVEYAGQIRGDVAYITPTAFGCYVGLSTSRIITHVVEKKIPAVRTLGGRWKIQVNEIKTFEHHNEKQGRGPKKRYTDDERQFIHDGARAGRSYREIGADLHRSERAINRMILLEKRQAKEVA